jgi:hypothetical protein
MGNRDQLCLFAKSLIATWPTKGEVRAARRRVLESAVERDADAVTGATDDRIPVVAAGRDGEFRDQFPHLYGRKGE